MSHRLNRAGRMSFQAAALVASIGAVCGALADPAPPNPPATDLQRADKEMELRGVEDTLRDSEEQRRTIQTEIELHSC